MSTVATKGSSVKVHYRGTLNDGTVFDSSYDRGETIGFTVGDGMMIPGFNDAVSGMTTGEVRKISLTSDQCYGQHHPEAVREIPRESFPDDFSFEEGAEVMGTANGAPVRGTIQEVKEVNVTIDFNHPMAGKDLNFEIELVSVADTEGGSTDS